MNKILALFLFIVSVYALHAQCGGINPKNAGKDVKLSYSFQMPDFKSGWRKETTKNNEYYFDLSSRTGRLKDGYLVTVTNKTGDDEKPKRAEYGRDLCDTIGQNKWVSLSFRIPPNKFELSKKNLGREIMIFQFHSKPDKNETWGYYRANLKYNRPSVALYVVTFNNKDYYTYFRYGNNGKDEFEYKGWKWATVGLRKIEVGEWYDITVNVKWSDTNTGYMAAWINNQPFTPYNGFHNRVYGPNMHNGAPNYFKFGQYRYYDEPLRMELHFDEVRVGNSLEEVSLYEELPVSFVKEREMLQRFAISN